MSIPNRSVYEVFACRGLFDFVSWFSFPSWAAVQTQKTKSFSLNSDHVFKLENFLDGRNPLLIDYFDHPDMDRHIMEMFWFMVAPMLGGCNCQIDYIPSDDSVHARSILQVKNGIEVAHPIAIFKNDPRIQPDTILLSEPIFGGEDFFVGFFTDENRKDVLKTDKIEEIKKLQVGVAENWPVDIAVIKDHQFPMVKKANRDSIIVRGRADVTLQPFRPTADFGFDERKVNTYFRPIVGFKAVFNYGRRFFVSSKHPFGPELLAALNRPFMLHYSTGFK